MAEVGILNEDSRVELIDGKIIAMNPVGHPHVVCVDLLTEYLVPLGKAHNFRVSVQNPMRIDEYSEPEPDLVLYEREENYKSSKQKSSALDAMLVIEVADTTLKADQTTKKELYIASGVREYLIVNLPNRRFELYSDLTSDGQDYGTARYFEEDAIFKHSLFGEVMVSDFLPTNLTAE